MPGEQLDVGAAFAQRRHADADDVEPVVEVLAELAALDRRLEILVGRGEEAHVDAERVLAADRAHALVLQHAQELHLQRERQLADLVEEERAAVRLADQAFGGAPLRRCTRPSRGRRVRDSISSAGIAPQFTGTNGPEARPLP